MAGKEVVAAGFIVFRTISSEIQYLLLQTSYGQHHWTPPKGHVDPGESEFDTALRETTEEAGLNRSHLEVIDNFKKTLNYPVNGRPKRVVYWLAKMKDPEMAVTLSDEHIDFKWLKVQEANELITQYKDLQAVLNDADEYLKSKYSNL
ncbi:bis(5'-nucleosyl)-tetraphosphatase [asymmetrical]-like [Ylistrum balloti]|uniref:bis(5'-nucleosyl)-tetraphosphatase [asymmetrical]-like n=1 Tax=Ylistrum balloti TaxID=509963 RepID=UPI002905A172|nr:bis(5'-nucleosyl)-tetraphosphatase [asymmetrical]-like [Ylistrum balloti]